MNKSHSLVYLVFFLVCTQVSALTVNRLNGGANIIYVDFSLPGTSVPLELIRSYSSITAANETNGWLGAFGWGWSSGFETTLTTTPERHVILRDGSSANTIVFKPEKEDPKVREAFFKAVKIAYYEKNKGRKLTNREQEKLQLPDNMLSRLKSDPSYRVEIAAKYAIEGTIPKGELLVSSEYGYQTIQYKNGNWIRERDPFVQVFDKEGRLLRQTDKGGFTFQFRYSPGQKGQLTEIYGEDKTASLKFTFRQDRVVEVTDNRNHKAKYSYDGRGNLTQSTDSNNQTYGYRYDNKKFPHLITRIDYNSESTVEKPVYREVTYDENGLVSTHRDKDGSETTYTYGKMSSNPENNFWTKTVTKGNGKNEEEYDEYLIKAKPDGTKYLHRQETRIGKETTVTIYTPCCGRPLQVTKNGETTNYKYYDNGLLKEKTNAKEAIALEYDPRWKKVSKVAQNNFVSYYDYDGKGNLVKARNSNKENLALKYDRFGRILEMTDPEGKHISFKYNDQGKPIVIAEKGVGTIKIEYDLEGRIRRTETLSSGASRKPSNVKSQEVVKRVMQGFQHLLDIIRPAGASFAG